MKVNVFQLLFETRIKFSNKFGRKSKLKSVFTNAFSNSILPFLTYSNFSE